MAKVLAERSLLSVSGGRSAVVPRERRGRASPAFLRCGLKSSSCGRDFYGRRLVLGTRNEKRPLRASPSPNPVLMTLSIGKSQKWWEKGLQPNMKEIESAEDLSNALLDAGDQLVIVDFFSPGCAGCRALHPKICQFAEMNPGIQFLQVNHEKHKSMCYSLNVHVLPFFRFYRGAHGRLCSFSCTNATIKKFKDALAKHTTDRCSLGPARGLEESELLALAANKDLSFNYTAKPVQPPAPQELEEKAPASPPLPVYAASSITKESVHKTLVSAGR